MSDFERTSRTMLRFYLGSWQRERARAVCDACVILTDAGRRARRTLPTLLWSSHLARSHRSILSPRALQIELLVVREIDILCSTVARHTAWSQVYVVSTREERCNFWEAHSSSNRARFDRDTRAGWGPVTRAPCARPRPPSLRRGSACMRSKMEAAGRREGALRAPSMVAGQLMLCSSV